MKLLVALLVAVAAAASVTGTAISRQALNSDLSAIAGSTGFQCFLQAQLEVSGKHATGLFPVTGAGKVTTVGSPPTYNNSFVRYWLGKMSDDVLVEQMLQRRHVSLTADDLTFGRTSFTQEITTVLGQLETAAGASCGVSSASLLASLPASFVAEQVRAQTALAVLSAHLAGFSLSTEALQRYFQKHAAEFDTECISYVGYASQADATAARSQIEGGTPIAKTGTAAQIGCGPQVAITSLPAAVVKLPVGQLSQPVSEGTGTKYALLFVTARNPTPFAKIRTTVAQVLLNSGSTKTTAVLTLAGARAEVTADPRYGQVRPLSVELAAPLSPATGFVPDPWANLPPAQKAERGAASAPTRGATTSPAAG
jgi:hypothetical protein